MASRQLAANSQEHSMENRAKSLLEMNANDFLTRQSCWKVYIVVVYREVNFFLSGAQQTPICEYGHSSMDVVEAGCRMLLDEN